MSFRTLKSQKMRTFLTMLGIIIGIASIIIITSVVAGAQSLITNQFASLGPTVIGILPGATDGDGPPAAVMGIVITTLTDDDTEAVRELPHVKAVSSYVSATDVVYWENQKTTASIYGVSPDFPNISDTKIESGSFFTEDDKKGNNNVVVIGSKISEDLFEGKDPIGEKIKIKTGKYLIVGTMAEQGSTGFVNMDNTVLLPVTTAQKKLLGLNYIGFMRAKADSEENIDRTIDDIKFLLRDRHNLSENEGNDFTVESIQSALEALQTITEALQFFLIAVIAISLVVGGIGIMNIMLASVTERIKEIGLRKAVGAKKNHIVYQFLVETIALTFFGAIIGIIIGIIISYLIAIIVNKLDYDWDFVITPFSIILSCIFSFLVGLLFGLYPARKASKLNSIEALRYE